MASDRKAADKSKKTPSLALSALKPEDLGYPAGQTWNLGGDVVFGRWLLDQSFKEDKYVANSSRLVPLNPKSKPIPMGDITRVVQMGTRQMWCVAYSCNSKGMTSIFTQYQFAEDTVVAAPTPSFELDNNSVLFSATGRSASLSYAKDQILRNTQTGKEVPLPTLWSRSTYSFHLDDFHFITSGNIVVHLNGCLFEFFSWDLENNPRKDGEITVPLSWRKDGKFSCSASGKYGTYFGNPNLTIFRVTDSLDFETRTMNAHKAIWVGDSLAVLSFKENQYVWELFANPFADKSVKLFSSSSIPQYPNAPFRTLEEQQIHDMIHLSVTLAPNGDLVFCNQHNIFISPTSTLASQPSDEISKPIKETLEQKVLPRELTPIILDYATSIEPNDDPNTGTKLCLAFQFENFLNKKIDIYKGYRFIGPTNNDAHKDLKPFEIFVRPQPSSLYSRSPSKISVSFLKPDGEKAFLDLHREDILSEDKKIKFDALLRSISNIIHTSDYPADFDDRLKEFYPDIFAHLEKEGYVRYIDPKSLQGADQKLFPPQQNMSMIEFSFIRNIKNRLGTHANYQAVLDEVFAAFKPAGLTREKLSVEALDIVKNLEVLSGPKHEPSAQSKKGL